VDKDGKVSNAKVVKSVEESLDNEALRVVNKMHLWTPAVYGGRLVKSYKRLPVVFKLEAK
jgi:protein TonB